MTPAAGSDAAGQRLALVSTITCPVCGTAKAETMPDDACQFFYDCTGCGALLRAKPGDCCVFCSYGDVPCPPVQAEGKPGCCAVAGGGACDG
ncbi:MAG: hypothetical protein M0Z28_02315 [Rhodospirillales bacterium]|nr:hypothetical protein [Rhodospirillales bacterium]